MPCQKFQCLRVNLTGIPEASAMARTRTDSCIVIDARMAERRRP